MVRNAPELVEKPTAKRALNDCALRKQKPAYDQASGVRADAQLTVSPVNGSPGMKLTPSHRRSSRTGFMLIELLEIVIASH